MDKDTIILGSGHVYMGDYDKAAAIPTDAELETDANTLGWIKGGAELSYTPTEYEVTNDFGHTIMRFITKEEVGFKSGILTWALENLARLCPGVLSSITNTKEKVLKIGGASAIKSSWLRFVHTKADGKKLRITLVATPASGFTLTFNPETETTVDAQFKALSQTDGTLVEIREEMPETAETETPPEG